MRLSNRRKLPYYNFINTFLLVFFFGGIAAFFLEKIKFDVLGWESYLFIIIPVLLLYIFYLKGRQIFEYDSDGEALNFRNRSFLPIFGKPASDEFPKYKLLKYEVVDAFLFKRLFITIPSKKSNSIVLKYDISYITKKELRDLKFSLNKVIKANKEIIEQRKETLTNQ